MIYRRGVWDLPKGHLEEGEDLRECAAREVCEECGLVSELLAVGERITKTTHSYVSVAGRAEEKHTTWFVMCYRGAEGDAVPQTEEDITQVRWMTPDEARAAAATSFETIRCVLDSLPPYPTCEASRQRTPEGGGDWGGGR